MEWAWSQACSSSNHILCLCFIDLFRWFACWNVKTDEKWLVNSQLFKIELTCYGIKYFLLGNICNRFCCLLCVYSKIVLKKVVLILWSQCVISKYFNKSEFIIDMQSDQPKMYVGKWKTKKLAPIRQCFWFSINVAECSLTVFMWMLSSRI